MKKLVLTYLLSSLFCVGSAHLFANESVISHLMAQKIEEKADLDLEKPDHQLQLKDFVGDWVLTAESVGGVAGSNAVGDSVFLNAQVFIDRKGIGTINFGSVTIWNGQSLSIINVPKGTLIEFAITDPHTGTGTFKIEIASIPISITIEFVAVISKKTGLATALIGHRQFSDVTAVSALKVEMVRQFQ